MSFCIALRIPLVPISILNLSRYVALLSNSLAYSSITAYLNIVRLLHVESGLPNPVQDYYIKSVLKGSRRLVGDKVTPKLPITPGILLDIFKLLDLSLPLHLMFWAAALTAFFGMLCKSNLFPPQSGYDPTKHLSRSDFYPHGGGLDLHLKWSKTIQFADRVHQVLLPLVHQSHLCPVTALLLLFSKFPVSPNEPAFSFKVMGKLSVLSYPHFIRLLRGFLSRLGVPGSKYAGHSFRRGGASWAFTCGARTELIKHQGDWKSSAYLRYLDLPLTTKMQVGQAMATGISHP